MKYTNLLTALLWAATACAQNNGAPFAVWAFPGVSWQPSLRWKLTGQYGINPQLDMHLVYLQAFVQTGKFITLNPAWLYLNREGALPGHEHTFMNAVIFHMPLGKLLIDDRNLLWNRFRSHAEDIHYYRNRLRLTLPLKIHAFIIKPYVFNEVFYFPDRERWSRNRIAAGIACDIAPKFNLDVSYLHEHDYYSGRINWLFIMGTFQFFRHPHPTHDRQDQHH